MKSVMPSLGATRVDTDKPHSPYSTYRTDKPPYEVLTYLNYEGYKVVGTNNVGLQHM